MAVKLPLSFDILKLKCCKFLLSWRYFPCHSVIGHLNSLSFGFSSLINCYIFAGREEKPTWMVFGQWLHPFRSEFHFCVLLKAKCIHVAYIYSAENAVMLRQESSVIRFEHTAVIYISITRSIATLVKTTHYTFPRQGKAPTRVVGPRRQATAGSARGLPARRAAAAKLGTPRPSFTAAGCDGVISDCAEATALPTPATLVTHTDKFRIQAPEKDLWARSKADLCQL